MSLDIQSARVVFQDQLDQQMMEELTSSFMDANAGDVIYEGGREIKIPSISMDGLKKYDRSKGYPKGSVTLSYATHTMTQDRGTSFLLDAMDVSETNFIASAGNVMGEFQRTKVVPEVDAYRYSKVFAVINEKASENVKAKALTEKDIYKEIASDIAIVRDKCGQKTELVVVINGLAKAKLDNNETFTKTLSQAEFKVGEISTMLRTINECPIITVPSDRMYTAYDFYDGNDENSGFKKTSEAKLIQYMILPKKAVVAVCKQDKSKIIDPDTNQDADAWFVGYRKYHDAWVKESNIGAIRICTEA